MSYKVKCSKLGVGDLDKIIYASQYTIHFENSKISVNLVEKLFK